MITPSFSPTATERVLPKLALDFTTASLDSRVTFTRTTDATHPATYVNSSGLVTSATNNQPRFDYSTTSVGTCKGLLIEESRTNLCLNSEDMSAASWTYVAPLSLSATNVVVAPTGATTADRLSTTSAGSVYQDFSITGTNTHTVSFFVHTSSTCTNLVVTAFYLFSVVDSFLLEINPTTGAILSSNATTYGSQSYGNGWYRFWMTKAGVIAANNTLRVQMYDNVASANTLVVWGTQVEVGAFPTSYIPTTSAALTRNADVATMTGTNFSSWYNATEGTIYAKADCYTATPSPTRSTAVFNKVSGASGYMSLKIPRPSTATGFTVVNDAGATSADLSGQSITANTQISVVGSYKTDNFAFSDRGVSIATDLSGAIPTSIDRFCIGSDLVTYQNGHIQKIMYWPMRLTNAEVQAFSKS